jgi:uncharacterized SAM-binding protein YcdF (DUF218 family)
MTRPAPVAPPRRRSGWAVMLSWLLVLGLVAAAAAPVVVLMDVVASARAYDTERTDAIAVLGASQYWGTPSPVFENRLDHAAELWDQGVAPVIITVGGKIEGDITTEAEAGRAYLIERGIPADQVIALPGGSDTVESIEMVGGALVARDADSVTLVSDRVHLARSKAVAEALGFDAYVSGRAFEDGSSFVPERIVREVGGLLKFHLWDRWFLADLSDPA